MKRHLYTRLNTLFAVAFAHSLAWAAPQIQVTVDPARSRNGEPVTFRLKVESEVSETLRPPKIPVFSDWEVINSYQSRRLTSRIINGKISSKNSWESTFILKPLRKGNLKIPSLSVNIGARDYQTEALDVAVDQLPDGSAQRPRLHNPQAQAQQPEEDPFQDPFFQSSPIPRGIPPSAGLPGNEENHSQETFFLRAEPSKNTVYLGEMLLLSYAIYQKNIPIQNAEIGKFPEFRGFLKEDLLVPKVFSRTPVEFGGQNWNRSEIIRYALFPIQSGNLKIDPMVFRATIAAGGNMADVIQSLLNGQPPPQASVDIPTSKSSQVLNITVKPLPPAPAGVVFTGGVGQFTMDAALSSATVSVDQPFTITLKINGLGNVQAIEESKLKLPPQIESYQTKHQHRFAEDGSGEKTFEYLLMPRQPGDYSIPPIELTYFDPKSGKYETLKTQSFEINAKGGAAAPESNAVPTPVAKPQEFSFPALNSGVLVKTSSFSTLHHGFTSIAAWAGQALFYLLALFYYLNQRRKQLHSQFLTTSPWKKTEKKILAKKDWSASELAEMLDEWMRQRLLNLCVNKRVDLGSPREDFLDDLKLQLAPENYKVLSELKTLWSDLDVWRFSGNKSAASERQKSQDWLRKVEKLVGTVEKSRLRPASEE